MLYYPQTRLLWVLPARALVEGMYPLPEAKAGLSPDLCQQSYRNVVAIAVWNYCTAPSRVPKQSSMIHITHEHETCALKFLSDLIHFQVSSPLSIEVVNRIAPADAAYF